MITVISATNRKNSEALDFARFYIQALQVQTKEEVKLLALEQVAHDWFHPDMYAKNGQTPSLAAIQNEYMLPAAKFVFVIPEYNGSFPGVLKLFLDACSVRAYNETFKGKKVALLGIATGRAGNLRGMDHLTGILHFLGMIVLPNKLPISSIEKLKDSDGNIVDPHTREAIEQQAEELLHF
ncbi:MAG: NAD(P)H-dependent oxidoreductase [Saprospirales bacterium]|nr:NAD(P)H-dependent oxidoreductase [Saprospirales bacterium]